MEHYGRREYVVGSYRDLLQAIIQAEAIMVVLTQVETN